MCWGGCWNREPGRRCRWWGLNLSAVVGETFGVGVTESDLGNFLCFGLYGCFT